MYRYFRHTSLLLAVVPALFLSLAGSPQDNALETIAEIQFSSDGPLDRISSQSLDKLVLIQPGQPLELTAARNTVKRLFATGLFEDITIRREIDSMGRLIAKIELVERKLIKQIQFKNAGEVPERELTMAIALSPGQPYLAEQLPGALERLEALYEDYGFQEASVQGEAVPDGKEAAVRLIFRIEPGTRAVVDRLELNVDGGLEEEKLGSLLKLKVDGPYSHRMQEEDLKRIQEHLVEIGYLNPLVYVSEGPRYSSETQTVELTIRVIPRDKTEITFEGLPIPLDSQMTLPIYREGDASEVFVRDSSQQLRYQLQEKGYLQAKVDHRIRLGKEGDPSSVAFVISPGIRTPLAKILFEGVSVDAQTEEIMRTLLEARPKGFLRGFLFSDELVERDEERLRNFWAQQGYLNAKVNGQVAISQNQGILTFRIERGDQFLVGTTQIVGNSEIEKERLLEEVQSRQGLPYSPLQLAQDRFNILAVYENLGFRQANVQLETKIADHLVDCSFTIEEGPRLITDAVIVTGNRATHEEVIRREVPLEPGDPLSLGKLLGAETDLYNLSVFNRVQVREAESYQDENARTVIVQVEEAPRFSLVYGIGYSSFEGARGTVGITNNNLLGTARSLSVGLRAGSQRQRGNLTYSLPRLGRWKVPAVLSFSADNELAQAKNTGAIRRSRQGRPFDSFRLTASGQTEARLSQRESLFFRIEYEKVRARVPEGLVTALEFFREQERINLSSVSASYLNESRDNPIEPTRGFLLTADTQVASRILGSEEELLRFFLQGQYYRSLGAEVVWASALRVGVIRGFGRSDFVPISERFFSGGAGTLRGLPQDLAGPLLRDENGNIILVDDRGQILDSDDQASKNGRPVPKGGEALLIFNTEIRFPIYRFVRGVAFYDIGDVYERVQDLFKVAPTHSLGFGFHLKTPVGPVRLDVGYNPNPPNIPGFSNLVFHLTLGHPF